MLQDNNCLTFDGLKLAGYCLRASRRRYSATFAFNVVDAREGTDTTLHASNSGVQSQLRAHPIYSRVYARSIALMMVLCYLIPLPGPPLLALPSLAQQAWNSTLDVMSVIWPSRGVLTRSMLRCLLTGKAQGYADVRCRVAALAASFLLQMRVHSTQMACCEDNQGVAAAIRRGTRLGRCW
jgi:hypothetical protein